MSRHMSRKERWTQVNAKEYRAAFGSVRYVKRAWEGTVLYESWHKGETAAWRAEAAFAGRFKRPRNAMIAVEDKAREIARIHGDNVKVAI
jgi:hypothetical protein